MYNAVSKSIIAGIITSAFCLAGCSSKSAERISLKPSPSSIH